MALFGWNPPIFVKIDGIWWKSHFSPPNRLLGAHGLENPKKPLVLTVSERGAPPGPILGFCGHFHKNWWNLVKLPWSWWFYLNLVILGHFGVILGDFGDFHSQGRKIFPECMFCKGFYMLFPPDFQGLPWFPVIFGDFGDFPPISLKMVEIALFRTFREISCTT